MTSPTQAQAPTPRKRPFWREFPALVFIAVLVALLLKTFLVQAFYIPSLSMYPTLKKGDRVLVEKVSGYVADPKPGQVVVFKTDFLASGPAPNLSLWSRVGNDVRELFGLPTSGREDYIKRVIAVGGQRVSAQGGNVLVDGKQLPEPYLRPGVSTADFGPVVVPKGDLFVMGDNRAHSDDSRSFGGVPLNEVVGHAFTIVWPLSDATWLTAGAR